MIPDDRGTWPAGGDALPGPLARWLLAIRPRTLPAAVAPVVLATGIAESRGVLDIAPAAAALVGALLIQIATNLANDYFDFVKGGDREDRLGPIRVVQAGLLSKRAVLTATGACLGLAVLVGAYLVQVGGVPILVIGVVSLACAVAYTGGPFPLAYHGLGEPFAFVFFGPVAVAGAYWVQALDFPLDLLFAGFGVGALTTAILVVNNLRDIESDARAGKRTLAVRIGPGATRAEYLALVFVAAGALALGVGLAGWSPWTLLGLVGLWPVVRALRIVFGFEHAQELNGALAATARGVAWYAGFTGLGFVMGG